MMIAYKPVMSEIEQISNNNKAHTLTTTLG